MTWTDIILLILAGSLGGFLSGLLGVGGGIIFVPMLDIVFTKLNFPKEEMVSCILANSFFIIVFTGILSSRRQYINKNYYAVPSVYTGIGALFTLLPLTWAMHHLFKIDKQTFNILFICLLAPLIIKMLFTRPPESSEKGLPSKNKFLVTGIFTGIFSAFSGLGGGLLMIPIFTDVFKIDIKKATSVSAGTVPFLALPAVVLYLWEGRNVVLPVAHAGYIVWSVSALLLLGVLLTVSLGVNTARRLPSHVVKKVFGTFAILVMTKMIVEAIY